MEVNTTGTLGAMASRYLRMKGRAALPKLSTKSGGVWAYLLARKSAVRCSCAASDKRARSRKSASNSTFCGEISSRRLRAASAILVVEGKVKLKACSIRMRRGGSVALHDGATHWIARATIRTAQSLDARCPMKARQSLRIAMSPHRPGEFGGRWYALGR